MKRVLTVEDYAKLFCNLFKVDKAAPQDVAQMRQVHRLLCDGHKVEDLTPVEQLYVDAFDGLTCVQIPNDYGWEPGVEVLDVDEAMETLSGATAGIVEELADAAESKPKKNRK